MPSMARNPIYRLVGDPPAAGAMREAQLRWVRKFYCLTLIALLMIVIFALLTSSTFLWGVAAAVAVIWACGLASISMSIRRASSGAEG